MSYRAPLPEILFTMREAAGLDQGIASGLYADLADGMTEQILGEAAKLAEDILAPINRKGDQQGCRVANGAVITPDGWIDAYRKWQEGGWSGVTAPAEHGGMGLPQLLDSACQEVWTSANMAFMLCPMVSAGAIEALVAHGSSELQRTYLPKIVSGEWTATMNLTEPQAGSDLNALRTRAERVGDGTYRIKGQKIFITYGEHDLTENIVHLVLARLPDAPPGTRGISLFVTPKFLVNPDGSPGARNDLRCHSIEHKMGIHGSPTCTMIFGDNDGAIGWLVGEENRGLACMFTMMNNARLGVSLQGVAIAEAATQHALAYANDRRQGRAAGYTGDGMGPIVLHPDVRRNLMTMKALTAAARAICYLAATATDRAHRATDERERKFNGERAALLTPIAKAFSTDIGNEVASLGVQVHGGMGFIEETGAAQFMRDARISAIYEGTNGIQAIDLVQRKIGMGGGDVTNREIADMRVTLRTHTAVNAPEFGKMAQRLGEAVDALERATLWMVETLGSSTADALAGATPYLRLFGIARGGVSLARLALAAHRKAEKGAVDPAQKAFIAHARFFAENVAIGAGALELTITEGAQSVHAAADALAVA